MGWWSSDANGSSLQFEETGLLWGDGPADQIDKAIDEITREFETAWGRKPKRLELEAGFKFSLNGLADGIDLHE